MNSVRSIAAVIVMISVLAGSFICPCKVNANTDSGRRSTWAETEKYCKSKIGKMEAPTCADFVSSVMRDCGYYPGKFRQTASSSNLRAQLKDNGYTLVGYNNTYRKSKGIDSYSAVKLGNWIADKAKPGDILIWVKNTTVNYSTTAAEHASIYAGIKSGLSSHGGKTTWPAHYSDPGAGKTVKLQALWVYANTGSGSGRGYGVYIYRKPKDTGKWVKDETGYTYYDAAGTQVIGKWYMINGKWYCFGEDGYMLTGLCEIGEKKYYLDESGAMVTGWRFIGNCWYCFCADGHARTGWYKEGRKWYFMDDEGIMQTGFIDLDGITYYLNQSGAMVTGWRMINGLWYYFDKTGEMLRDTEVEGYVLSETGAMIE